MPVQFAKWQENRHYIFHDQSPSHTCSLINQKWHGNALQSSADCHRMCNIYLFQYNTHANHSRNAVHTQGTQGTRYTGGTQQIADWLCLHTFSVQLVGQMCTAPQWQVSAQTACMLVHYKGILPWLTTQYANYFSVLLRACNCGSPTIGI